MSVLHKKNITHTLIVRRRWPLHTFTDQFSILISSLSLFLMCARSRVSISISFSLSRFLLAKWRISPVFFSNFSHDIFIIIVMYFLFIKLFAESWEEDGNEFSKNSTQKLYEDFRKLSLVRLEGFFFLFIWDCCCGRKRKRKREVNEVLGGIWIFERGSMRMM